tara:strand:+ start:1069 stop:1686 length:618 start_codon:yes stop_codon:yes gene_type:complete
MINKLTKLASHLDLKGLRKEADYLDALIRKFADIDEKERGVLDGLEKLLNSRDPIDNDKTTSLKDCMEKKLDEQNSMLVSMTSGSMDYSFHDEKSMSEMYESARQSCLKELYGSEEEILNSWLAIVQKIEDRKEEIENEGGGFVPIIWDEQEVEHRMILKNDFDWSQERIDEYQNQRPSWKKFDDDSQWETPVLEPPTPLEDFDF